MKRICVVTSTVPFVRGGNELLAETLVRQLVRFGHEAQLLTVPQNRFGRQFSAYLAAYLTDVRFEGCPERVDQVISLKFPSFAVRHPVHVCWFNHRMREYYDLWEKFLASLASKRQLLKESVRRVLLHQIDAFLLNRNVTKLYAQSKNIQQRLLQFGHIPSEVLYPPASDLLRCSKPTFGRFILSPARLVELKRHDLLIRALADLKRPDVHAIIAGEGPQENELKRLAEQMGLADKVKFVGEMSYEALSRYYSECLAVFYGPFNEDYGLVTLEAGKCHKPVITCTDSGGPKELVRDGETGFVCEPSEHAIANAIDTLASDQGLARSLGENAYEASLEHSWEHAIEKLVMV